MKRLLLIILAFCVMCSTADACGLSGIFRRASIRRQTRHANRHVMSESQQPAAGGCSSGACSASAEVPVAAMSTRQVAAYRYDPIGQRETLRFDSTPVRYIQRAVPIYRQPLTSYSSGCTDGSCSIR